MSIALDGYGNIIGGGYFGGSLFSNHSVETLNNIGGVSLSRNMALEIALKRPHQKTLTKLN